MADDLSNNPFMNLAPEQQLEPVAPTCGDPSCTRSHRPINSIAPGAHYSADLTERAAQLTEDGKFGPSFGHLSGGRGSKRSKRAAEVVSEFAVEAAPKIRKAFEDGLDDSNSIGVRQATALHLLGIEKDEHLLRLKEEQQEFNQMTKAELVQSIMQSLGALSKAGEIAGEIIEGTVVEEDE